MVPSPRARLMLLASLGLGLAASPAAGDVNSRCGPRGLIVEALKSGWGEEPGLIAVSAENQIAFETLVSPSGSWTLLALEPGGRACVLAAGEAWRAAPALSPAMR